MVQLTKTEQKRRVRAARSRKRAIAFGIVASVVIGLTGFLLWRAFAPIPAAAADVRIQTTMEGFTPRESWVANMKGRM